MMKVAAVKTNKQEKSRAAAHSIFQKKRNPKGALRFVDNRSQGIAIRKFQAKANRYSASDTIQKNENKTEQNAELNAGKKKVSDWVKGTIIQCKVLDLQCTAEATYGRNKKTAVGYNGEKQDVEGRITKYGGEAGITVFEGEK